MKLLIATPLYPPEIGGPATYAKLLYEGLPKKKIEVELVKFSGVRHFPRIIRHLVYFWRVYRALCRADIALALDPVSVGLPVCLAARLARKRFIVKIVGDYAWEQGRQRFGITETLDEFVKTNNNVPLPVRILQRIQTRVARSATRVIVPSEYLKNIVATWGTSASPSTGIQSEKIEVIYNATSIKEIGKVPEVVAKLPRPLVVNIGRLVPWKHVDGVIDAVSSVFSTALAIIGDGPEYEALARRANEKLVERAILTGSLSHEDTLAVMKSADVLVLNSSYEGLSHLLIEAFMLGVPVIATRVGGNPEVITDGVDGILVPVGDTPALAHAIALVFGDEKMRARLSARAKESSRRFSTELMLAQTFDVIRGLGHRMS